MEEFMRFQRHVNCQTVQVLFRTRYNELVSQTLRIGHL